jgi:hypothetical protein
MMTTKYLDEIRELLTMEDRPNDADLLQAIEDLLDEVTKLKAKIAVLKGKIDELTIIAFSPRTQ